MQSTREDGADDDLFGTASISLQFPTIPVAGTPTKWISSSHLITMATPHDDSSCDEATSSLGDSTYDFIDDRSVVTTDDEEQDGMTESTTSSCGNERDRRAISRTEPESGPVQRNNRARPRPNHIDSAESSLSSGSGFQAVGRTQSDLGLGSDASSADALDPIEFDEPSITNLNSARFIEVSHDLKSTENQEIPGTLFKPGNVTVSVRQNMISRSLDLEGKTYKVLFVGDQTMKDAVIQKIGSALAAAPKRPLFDSERRRSSRFNIVPVSSFDGESNPEVVLVDVSGIEMSVEECSGASYIRKEGGYDTICLKLFDGTAVESSWSRSKFVLSNDWKLPDLAIFSVPKHSRSKQDFQIARSFTSRHHIPSIIISRNSLKEKPSETLILDFLAPHICVEHQNSREGKRQVIQRLPIDRDTFLRIDAGQMNRNLACLATASRSFAQAQEQATHTLKSRPNAAFSPFTSSFGRFWGDVYNACHERIEDQCGWIQEMYRNADWSLALSLSWLVFGTIFALMCLEQLLGGSRISSSRVIPTGVALSFATTHALSTPTNLIPVPTVPTSATLSASSDPISVSAGKILSTPSDITSLLLDAYGLAPNKSEQFKVHVVGDCHIVMRPPHWFTKMRNAPRLLFKIARKGFTLEHKVSILFDGLYLLQVPREEAYGILGVSISTDSKPHVKENYEVDFGSSWLKVAAWKNAALTIAQSARSDLDLFQSSVSVFLNQTKTDLSALTRQAQAVEEGFIGQLPSSLGLTARAKDLIIPQMKALSHSFSSTVGNTRSIAAEQSREYARSLTKRLTLSIQEKKALISNQVRSLTQTTTGADMKALVREMRDWRTTYIQHAQKKVLKAWWKIRGLPTPRVVKVEKKKGFRGRRVHFVGDEL